MAGFVALVLAYVMSQFYRSFLAVLTTVLEEELAISPGQLSLALGAWFITFALMQFPVGYFLDSRGPRLTAALLHGIAGGGGAALFAMSQNAYHLIFAMGLIGIGCSPVLMAAVYLIARQFSAVRFAMLSSLFISIGTLGNVVSSEPMAAATATLGWRQTSWLLCAITVAIGIAIWIFVKDPEKLEASKAGGSGDGYWTLLQMRQLWPILPCVFFGYAVAAGIRGLWAGPLLEEMYGLQLLEIGRISLFLAIALSVGTLVYGPLDRIFNSRKWVVFAGNVIVLAAAVWFAIAPPTTVAGVTVLLVMICFFGASYPVQLAHVKAFVPAHLAGRGVTLMNFCSIGGVGVMQFITGYFFEFSASRQGEAAAFGDLFYLYAATLGAALALYLFSRDVPPATEESGSMTRSPG